MKPQQKTIFQSKTLVVNFVIAVAAFYPPLAQLVTSHPSETIVLLSAANILLRFATKGKVGLFSDTPQ